MDDELAMIARMFPDFTVTDAVTVGNWKYRYATTSLASLGYEDDGDKPLIMVPIAWQGELTDRVVLAARKDIDVRLQSIPKKEVADGGR